MDFEIQPMVFDNGSYYMKVGYAGDEQPRWDFPTVIGRPRLGVQENFIGHDAQSNRGRLSLKYPIEKGIVRNWDDMEKLWSYAYYNELRTPPEEGPTLLTEKPWNPTSNREKATEIMFETFNSPSMCLISDSALSVLASGKVTGLALNMGDSVCAAVPVYEGHTVRQYVSKFKFGGWEIVDYLAKILTERGNAFETYAEKEVVRDIVRTMCYIVKDYEAAMRPDNYVSDRSYNLPDGGYIYMQKQLFSAPEALFQPSLLGREDQPIHQLIYDSIFQFPEEKPVTLNTSHPSLFSRLPHELVSKISRLIPPPLEARNQICGNIVLSGGPS